MSEPLQCMGMPAVFVTPLQRLSSIAPGFAAAAEAVLSGAVLLHTPESFVAFVRSYSPKTGLKAALIPSDAFACCVASGGLLHALRLTLRTEELFAESHGLHLPILPPPTGSATHSSLQVALSTEQVDCALAHMLFCAKVPLESEWGYQSVHDLSHPATVAALLSHFTAAPSATASARALVLTRVRVRSSPVAAAGGAAVAAAGGAAAAAATPAAPPPAAPSTIASLLAACPATTALPAVAFSRTPGPVRVLFSDSLIGGGTLAHGGTQEEALLRQQPTALAALLLAQRMESTEAIALALPSGAQLIAMDAFPFAVVPDACQHSPQWVEHEASKALAGFLAAAASATPPPASVSTAAWGCGTFGGDTALKFCLQWLAAALAGMQEVVWETAWNSFEADARRIVGALGQGSPQQLWAKALEYRVEGAEQTFLEFITGASTRSLV